MQYGHYVDRHQCQWLGGKDTVFDSTIGWKRSEPYQQHNDEFGVGLQRYYDEKGGFGQRT